MKKILILTEEINLKSENNGFFHSAVLDMLENFSNIIIICLRLGENNLSQNPKVKLIKLDQSGRVAKILNLLKLIFSQKSNYDEVLVHRNPEYVALFGIFWKLMGKKIILYYAHKHSDWKLWLATIVSDEIYTSDKTLYPIESRKVKIINNLSDLPH